MRALKINPGHAITALALSPDGQKIGVAQSFHGFRLFDAITGTELGHDADRANVIESAPTGRHSLNADRSAIRIAEVTAGRPFMRFQTGWTRVGTVNRPPAEPVTSAIPTVAALYQFGETPDPLAVSRIGRKLPAGHFAMYDCALTADHRFAVGRRAAGDSFCSVCDLATETVAVRLSLSTPNTDPVRVAFTADGTRVVVVSAHLIAAFELPPEPDLPPAKPLVVEPTFLVRVTQPQPEPGVPPFALLPCGQKALIRGERSRVELRDLTTGEVLTVWKWGLPRVHALAVAGDGLTAAAGGASGRVVMWDLG